MRNPLRLPISVLAVLLAVVSPSWAQSSAEQRLLHRRLAGAVYTTTNAPGGNAVVVFDRLADGRLVPLTSVPTGGLGTGGGLGNQGALVLARQERFLLAVNAGSDTVSVFAVRNRGLQLIDVQASGGAQPVSVTEHRGVVYVLNAASDAITGFLLGARGDLRPLAGSTRGLSGAGTGAAQIAFSPDGDVLVVTEKATNKITTFQVDRDGYAGPAQVQDSNGQTPFGFAFGKRGQLLVSEAFGGAPDVRATSSYEVNDAGLLATISASVGTNQTAACWVAVTPNGRYAYVTNTGSGSISGYAISFAGALTLLDDDGRTGVTGGSPIDVALSDNGRFLYSLVAGTNIIAAFRIATDGSLAALPFVAGIPAGATGLAAR